MECKNCKQQEAVKYSKYTSGDFCSRECSRAYSTKDKRKEINIKISISLGGRGNKNVKKECQICKTGFEVSWKKRNQVFCSRSCSTKWKNTNLSIAQKGGLASVASQSKKKRSKNEIYFYELCKDKFNKVLSNEPMFNGWDADVIIEDIKTAILWNGKWHYEKIKKEHSVEQVQNRDKIKLMEIENMGYKSYVIKDLGKANKEFVEKEFKKFIDNL
jgi:hypothetical protein